MKRLRYSMEEGMHYVHFMVSDGKEKLEFWTNPDFSGLFLWNPYTGSYDQTRGTCDFHLPSEHKARIRVLRKMFREIYG